ncbi:MAG: glutaminase A [Clostridia bacterium]|nr:glutaminase A [Clostridia bacterium]
MEKKLNEIIKSCTPYIKTGELASYIPELAKADANQFGICLVQGDGVMHFAGDCDAGFTMQSIIKPIILLLALMDKGMEAVHRLVGVEATGKPFDAFNYSDQALQSEHINPMINTGAIALGTLVDGNSYTEKFERLLALTRKMAGNPNLDLDEKVYLSEKATGNKNRALAYMLKAYGMLEDAVEDVLDFYFRACSVKATAKDLAKIAFILANKGKNSETGEELFSADYARYVNAVMMTCGMYDGSGAFAVNVGVPAKSGVGGGIMAVVPDKMGIGLFSPALDGKGNSVAGIKALELLSKELKLSIF